MKTASVSIKNAESFVGTPVFFIPSGQLTENERKCLEYQSSEDLTKSKFDLPIEFHIPVYEQWLQKKHRIRNRREITSMMDDKKQFGKYILSQKTSIMYLCQNLKPDRVSRFEFLKKSVLREALDRRQNFNAIRQMSIQLLRSNVLRKLNIINETEICPNIDEIPQELFSWSADDYFIRRDISNTMWLEMVERDFKDCLQTFKFKCDLKELCRYLDIILCGALTEAEDFSFEYEVVQPLEDASDLLSVYERLKSELEENREFVADLRAQYEASEAANAALEDTNRVKTLQQTADVNMFYPIHFRYQKAWYEAQVDQVEFEHDQVLTKLNENVSDWNFKILQENSALQNSLNMYYSAIEFYKTEINDFNAKFESEYEDLENAINYKKMSMSKIEVQRKYCNDQIGIMLNKIVQYRARKKLEDEDRRRMERQQAEANLLKLVKAEEKRLKKEDKQLKKQKAKKKK